ncbi:MAG: hypothetical protein ACT6R7_16820 [Brevundimonas aurantiaca]|jgi:hypothetical protein|uniref:hypothetical protein n=1 Tax=Brevundimonas aurantiaca TaxID=74316 RepID=UPI004034CE3B
MSDLAPLSVGQTVLHHTQRWTADGWQPLVERLKVVRPLIENDPTYAGHIELAADRYSQSVFVTRDAIQTLGEAGEAVTDWTADDWGRLATAAAMFIGVDNGPEWDAVSERVQAQVDAGLLSLIRKGPPRLFRATDLGRAALLQQRRAPTGQG